MRLLGNDDYFVCQQLPSPCYVLGDLHGNLADLDFFRRILWPASPEVAAGSILPELQVSCVVSVFTVTAAGSLLRLFFNASVNGLKTKISIELLLLFKLILSRQEIFSFSVIS